MYIFCSRLKFSYTNNIDSRKEDIKLKWSGALQIFYVSKQPGFPSLRLDATQSWRVQSSTQLFNSQMQVEEMDSCFPIFISEKWIQQTILEFELCLSIPISAWITATSIMRGVSILRSQNSRTTEMIIWKKFSLCPDLKLFVTSVSFEFCNEFTKCWHLVQNKISFNPLLFKSARKWKIYSFKFAEKNSLYLTIYFFLWRIFQQFKNASRLKIKCCILDIAILQIKQKN